MAVATGTRIGPYEIVAPVGAGGMGEVYRARDTRLGRDVAIKVLPAEFASDPERLRRFEQEARAAAALNHPNILVLFDVGRHEGQPYLITELLAGETLKEQIGRGGLTVSRSIDLGIQIARGLAAAHERGIVHRDLKPGNVFVTQEGTVKILDFGLAKLLETEGPVEVLRDASTRDPQTATGARLGTVGYMAPEQLRGQAVDHRADIFAFGCVLYEMLSGRRAFKGDTEADTISAILTRDPAPLSSSMEALPSGLERIVRRCLEKRPDDRFTSARDLGFALQAVAEAVPREAARKAEEIRPYPGLAAFTEADAERFFGRDEETAALWRKIPERRLLALIGPSGAGKTSFLRAGILPKAPPGWRCLVATPGQAPFAALARAFVPQFAGDTEATSQLFQIHEPAVAVRIVERWRERCDHALLTIDQFEELFTLNGEDVQARFADLLGRIAGLDGVHVVLSMRDDFLFACHGHKGLTPIFDSISPLGPPTGGELRRAVVEPAKRFGFAFEDDALVEEMVQAVEGERGALPLLAFAVARLWDERDKQRKLLTREAYERLGGVAGALAQHAESTLERIGAECEPIVREIFRNLSTAQQTRCAVDAEELLSVFPEIERPDARHVLDQLVDARLLTSFEVEAPDGMHHHRVEVVHESLLQRWPRLVRWQTQDADAAQLRDQLRQAAHLWEEKGKPDDLLWTGSTVTEYALWRERYPGGLSEVEESFGQAMTELAGRRRRRRRIAYAAVLAAVVVAATTLGLMWRKSLQETRRAEAEVRQHEAAKLLSLGRLRLADHPNAALAYAIASLERADNGPARRFAVEALWQGPPAFFLPTRSYATFAHAWSPDGRWLAAGGTGGVLVFERETGKHDRFDLLEEPMGFTADGQRMVNADERAEPRVVLHVRTVQGAALERSLECPECAWFAVNGDQVVTIEPEGGAPLGTVPALVRRFSLNESAAELLGRWEPEDLSGQRCVDIDPSGKWLFSLQSGRLTEQRLDALSSPGRVLGAHEGAGVSLRARPWQERVVTSDASGEIRIWNVPTARLERTLMSPADARSLALDPRGRFVATGAPLAAMTLRSQVLFDLRAPRTAEPVPLVASELRWLNRMSFSPDGNWLAGVFAGPVVVWNMAGTRSSVIGHQKPPFVLVAFTPDGRLVSTSEEGAVRLWPLDPSATRGMQVLWAGAGALLGGTLEMDPGGRFVVVADRLVGKVLIVPLDRSPASTYEVKGPPGVPIWTGYPRLDPSGTLLVVPAFSPARPELRLRRIVDLTTREERSVDTYPEGDGGCGGERQAHLWLPDGRLVTDGDGGLRLWDLETGKSRQLRPCQRQWATDSLDLLASHDARTIVRLDAAERSGQIATLSTFDITSGTTRVITSHGNTMYSFALDGSGTTLVTGALDGAVRVGLLNGEEPHLLYGHTATVSSVAISPDGRWIASGSDDGTIRLWPMPDLSKPPLHTWPREELLAKLKSLTNLRAVRDPSSETGWKIEVGPFPGWKSVPEWQP